MTKEQIKELNNITDEFRNEEYDVAAAIRKIWNADRKTNDEVIDTVVAHKPTKVHLQFMHREDPKDYRKKLRKAYERVEAMVREKLKEDKGNSL